MSAKVQRGALVGRFTHEIFPYSGTEELIDGVASFVAEGVEAGDAILVAAEASKLVALDKALDPSWPVERVDLTSLGRNPARITSLWLDFVSSHREEGRGFRGVGEPVWAQRGPEEISECHHQESIVNLAFGGGPPWRLLCPYDSSLLADSTIRRALEAHPFLYRPGVVADNPDFEAPAGPAERAASPLRDPEGDAVECSISQGSLASLRRIVREQAASARLNEARTEELVLAVNELATNSLRHGGGTGQLRIWREGARLVVEVADGGWMRDSLAGMLPPRLDREGGRGLWLVNQLCDLVQMRSSRNGTVVRAHVHSS